MRPKLAEYEVEFYRDNYFSVEGAIFHDVYADTYIASIEIIQSDGRVRLEMFSQDYKKLDKAIRAINTVYKKTIKKIYGSLND